MKKNQPAASSVKASEVTLPAETLKAVSDKTDAAVVIKTDVAQVKLDNKAAAAVALQAQTATDNNFVYISTQKVICTKLTVHSTRTEPTASPPVIFPHMQLCLKR
ncbi:MAG: hypothetical protein MR357_09215, partial [Anaeroplasma sp.]|nr:hypothetical protein [Anaeroplasma sp.]